MHLKNFFPKRELNKLILEQSSLKEEENLTNRFRKRLLQIKVETIGIISFVNKDAVLITSSFSDFNSSLPPTILTKVDKILSLTVLSIIEVKSVNNSKILIDPKSNSSDCMWEFAKQKSLEKKTEHRNEENFPGHEARQNSCTREEISEKF